MTVGACPSCLVRGLLLAQLAGNIDRAVDARAGGERARDLLALGDAELAEAVAPTSRREVLARTRSEASAAALQAALERAGCWSVCVHVPGYPSAFSDLGRAAPRALFCAGERSVLASLDPGRSVTLVGARRAGSYGLEVAGSLGRLLAGSGLTVLSGLALGVDSAAHEGALAGPGRTVAVLGTGPERAYPRSRRGLYERILAEGGLIASELPPGSPTFRWMFPARNRLMAALAGITVVVEAAERSGSLITAEMAIECGRQVGAVPGEVTSWRSAGTNKLLAEGAAVIRGAEDVLDLLLGPGVASAVELGPRLSERDRSVLDAIEAGAACADAAAARLGLPHPEVLAALGALERSGYTLVDLAGRISRSSLAPPPGPGGASL